MSTEFAASYKPHRRKLIQNESKANGYFGIIAFHKTDSQFEPAVPIEVILSMFC